MNRRTHALPVALLLLGGCRSDRDFVEIVPSGDAPGAVRDTAALHLLEEDGGQDDTGGDSGAPVDSGDTALPGEDREDRPTWCLDWERGDLEDAGYEGRQVELGDGALVLVAAEGDSYSALNGEEALDYNDDHALILRSSHDGRVDSVAIATTPLFRVLAPTDDGPGANRQPGHLQLWWWQLSEVDARGLDLYADLMDASGTIVASLDIPVQTGGFVPGLEPEHEPIDGFPEIVEGEGQPGQLVRQSSDLSAFEGQQLRLRLYQHTRVENNGFFTVLDDICLGRAASPADLSWGPPDPTH